MSKKVLCSDCGFLCWYVLDPSGEGIAETGTVWKLARKNFQEGKMKGRDVPYGVYETCDLGCLRGLWRWSYSKDVINSEEVNEEELRKPRECKYFFEYEPGYKPEEHKELKREVDTTRVIRNATLWGAAVGGAMGAAGAIAAQLIYAAVTSG